MVARPARLRRQQRQAASGCARSVTARGKTRTIVELVTRRGAEEDLPHAAVVAGRFVSTNNGNKIVVDTTNGTGANGFVGRALQRGDQRVAGVPGPAARHVADADTGEVGQPGADPDQPVRGPCPDRLHERPRHDPVRARSAQGARDRRRQVLRHLPGILARPATIVWIESGNCSYSSNATINSQAAPGLLLVNNGTLTLGGTGDYWGVIYCVNAQNSSGVILSLNGSGTLHGRRLRRRRRGRLGRWYLEHQHQVRGQRAAAPSRATALAGIIQNTWREIKALSGAPSEVPPIVPDMVAAIVLAALGGLIIGSFLNVVAYRLPRGESLAHPPSRLPVVRHADQALRQHPGAVVAAAARPLPRLQRADQRALPARRGADRGAVGAGRRGRAGTTPQASRSGSSS